MNTLRKYLPVKGAAAAVFIFALAVSRYGLLDNYIQLILMLIGINLILTLSLNLINGYMGEFSVGHAGFMAAGAYVSSILSVKVLAAYPAFWAFPCAVLAGGAAAGAVGLVVAVPSFKTRGDYLAIVTLAFSMIVKSVIENIDSVGGPRGFLGMEKLTTLPWVFFWVIVTVWIIRNFIYSRFGRGILSVREDEIAAELTGVNTRNVKMLAFVVSSFFAGVAGGLYAHLLQYISPGTFDIIKSTEMLVMVYLGGAGSIAGSIVGATAYTVLLEALRPLGIWRMAVMPLLLILLMIFRPRGIMGFREARWLVPLSERDGGVKQ
jgi:branched-chain amino acid transport system permease protein